MTDAGYDLHFAAEAEFREVLRYTRKKWGGNQARVYTGKLIRCMQALASGKKPFRELNSLFPNLRMVRCEHHYIFCIFEENAPALIVAILHERMDLMARLADRLKQYGI